MDQFWAGGDYPLVWTESVLQFIIKTTKVSLKFVKINYAFNSVRINISVRLLDFLIKLKHLLGF